MFASTIAAAFPTCRHLASNCFLSAASFERMYADEAQWVVAKYQVYIEKMDYDISKGREVTRLCLFWESGSEHEDFSPGPPPGFAFSSLLWIFQLYQSRDTQTHSHVSNGHTCLACRHANEKHRKRVRKCLCVRSLGERACVCVHHLGKAPRHFYCKRIACPPPTASEPPCPRRLSSAMLNEVMKMQLF